MAARRGLARDTVRRGRLRWQGGAERWGGAAGQADAPTLRTMRAATGAAPPRPGPPRALSPCAAVPPPGRGRGVSRGRRPAGAPVAAARRRRGRGAARPRRAQGAPDGRAVWTQKRPDDRLGPGRGSPRTAPKRRSRGPRRGPPWARGRPRPPPGRRRGATDAAPRQRPPARRGSGPRPPGPRGRGAWPAQRGPPRARGPPLGERPGPWPRAAAALPPGDRPAPPPRAARPWPRRERPLQRGPGAGGWPHGPPLTPQGAYAGAPAGARGRKRSVSRSRPAASRRGPRGRPGSQPRRSASAGSTRPNTRRGGTESSAGAAWGCVGCCSEPAALPLPRYEPASWRASRTVPQRWPNLVNGPLRGVPSPRKLWGDCCHAVVDIPCGSHPQTEHVRHPTRLRVVRRLLHTARRLHRGRVGTMDPRVSLPPSTHQDQGPVDSTTQPLPSG